MAKVEKKLEENDINAMHIKSQIIKKKESFINSSKLSSPRSFFNVTIMMNFYRLTSFIKFNIDKIIPKPCGMDLASNF